MDENIRLTISSDPLDLVHAVSDFRTMVSRMMEHVVRQTLRTLCDSYARRPDTAVKFAFRLGKDRLDMDRRLTIVCWIPNNAVWVGFRVEDPPRYEEGQNGLSHGKWVYCGQHDSCWRDALYNIVLNHEHEMRMFDWVSPWETVCLPLELRCYFKYLRDQARSYHKDQPPRLDYETWLKRNAIAVEKEREFESEYLRLVEEPFK